LPGVVRNLIFARRAIACSNVALVVFDDKFI